MAIEEVTFSIIITILAILTTLLQTYREHLPDSRKSWRAVLLWSSAVGMVTIAVLGVVDSFSKLDAEKIAEAAKNQARILEKVDGWRIQILDNTFSIFPKYVTVSSYVNFLKIDKEQGTSGVFKNKWFELATPQTKKDLADVEQSLEALHLLALEILNIEETHPRVIPRPLIDWAATTLAIDILQLEVYFDPYRPSEEMMHYLSNIGLGYAITKQIIRQSSAPSTEH